MASRKGWMGGLLLSILLVPLELCIHVTVLLTKKIKIEKRLIYFFLTLVGEVELA